jgi:hypothetical protein
MKGAEVEVMSNRTRLLSFLRFKSLQSMFLHSRFPPFKFMFPL